jgi:hypothetical protein
MASKFNNYDSVKWKESQELCTVQEVRPAADGKTKYLIQLGTDATAREWANESDLELVASAPQTDSGPGFYPAKAIMD